MVLAGKGLPPGAFLGPHGGRLDDGAELNLGLDDDTGMVYDATSDAYLIRTRNAAGALTTRLSVAANQTATAIGVGGASGASGLNVYTDLAFQQAATLSTTAGALTLAGASGLNVSTDLAFQQAATLSTTAGALTLKAASGSSVVVLPTTASARFVVGSGVATLSQTSDTAVLTAVYQHTLAQTTLPNSGVNRSISIDFRIAGTSNQNFTADPVGVIGYDVLIETLAGSTGTITGVAGYRMRNPIELGAVFTNVYGVYMETLSVGATNIGISMANDLDLRSAGSIRNVGSATNDWTATGITTRGTVAVGVSGSDQGSLSLAGVTSGVVTVAVAAAAGTWSMTLPSAVGSAGYQLTDAAGNGITSWAAAASLREAKQNVTPWAEPQAALALMLSSQVYAYTYRAGQGTLDADTQYVGLMADESPWAMHYNGEIVNPVNTLGYMVLGFQAMESRLNAIETELQQRHRRPQDG